MYSDQTTYAFTARATGAMAEFAHLTLYDGYLDTVLKGYGQLNSNLPAGLYRLVVVQGEQMTERSIRLDKPTEAIVPLKASESSVPADGMGNMHEYYSDPFKEFAFTPTTPASDPAAQESLFVFFRYADENSFARFNPVKESLGLGFILLDRHRKRLCDLQGKHIREEHQQYGWLALHVKLQPGTYYLYYNGRKADKKSELPALPAREIPVTVFSGWQTQCSMTFGSGPAFRSWFVALRNAYRQKDGYRPEDSNLYDIEGLLQKFNNGIFYLPDNVMTQLAYGKWENPILGLLAAYAYFHSGKHDRDELFRQVVYNSGGLLGAASPDYIALEIAARNYLPQLHPPLQPIREPGMFLTGIRAVLAAAGNYIVPGSIAEEAMDKLFSDMFWTSYTPISRFRMPGPYSDLAMQPLSHPVSIAILGESLSGKSYLPEKPRQKRISTAPRKPAILRSWVASSLMDLLHHPGTKDSTISDLAVALRVTPNMVEQAAVDIVQNEQAITAYMQGKEKDPAWNAFSNENIAKLKRLVGF